MFLSPHVVAKRLGISRRWVYSLLRRGRFPGAKKLEGSIWRIPAAAVEAYLGGIQ